ncbi:polynucleotide adenylyltransferase PcnB [Alkalimonas sp.]|uniref:polynucleotide adenylyltransferase PcnB n=1 Tax=Alkalimonas sp. TaxID=1872453 RepID=UPI00263B4ECD|nr:polynucleotide adenylyltransferase PcnB [Alkalimonas sp.]MCC5826719.1 polynucleotide adenylyltransferase PcnB [Alkalimonas sp.]
MLPRQPIITIQELAIISRVLDFCRRNLRKGNKAEKKTALVSPGVLPPLKRLSRDQHPISRKQISPNALKVLYRLKDAGFEAYLVGGCIRDLMLGLEPKDFDVATNAKPEEVRQVFRNCRLIGRRFRLAHVLFGREVIEVATFRGHHSQPDESEEGQHQLSKASEEGLILRDNVYGSIEEDAERRDFTINALYYSINNFEVLDFANGVEAIAERKIELIGDPETRYREDPVRILRAIRFATKLNMQIALGTAEPIPQLASLLKSIPPARLFEEFLKLFLAGKAFDNFMLMKQYGIIKQLLPSLHKAIAQEPEGKVFQLVSQALQDTDQRVADDKPVTPAFLFAAFLWYPVEIRSQTLQLESGLPPVDALNIAMTEILSDLQQRIALPKRFSLVTRDIWSLQNRLARSRGKRALTLLQLPKFRAGYDFLLLRAKAEGGELQQHADWWQRFQQENESGQQQMLQQAGPAADGPSGKTRRRRNYKRKRSSQPKP